MLTSSNAVLLTDLVVENARRLRKSRPGYRRRGAAGLLLAENIPADISGNGKDKLGKQAGKTRVSACCMSRTTILPISASTADFGDVDFCQ
ncbi:MAG: hypothetical protein ABWY18_05130 [Tardiphaga sp.]